MYYDVQKQALSGLMMVRQYKLFTPMLRKLLVKYLLPVTSKR